MQGITDIAVRIEQRLEEELAPDLPGTGGEREGVIQVDMLVDGDWRMIDTIGFRIEPRQVGELDLFRLRIID